VKRYGKYGKNCEMISKLWKKSKLKCENRWKIWKKNKLNREKIWKIWMKVSRIVKRFGKYRRKIS
jgi:hypothetical protein